MKKYKLMFDSPDVDQLRMASGTVFELISMKPATHNSVAVGTYATKRSYTNAKLLDLLYGNARIRYNITDSVVVEV